MKAGAFLDSSDESDNEEGPRGEGEGRGEKEGERVSEPPAEMEEEGEETSKVAGGGRKFLEDSEEEEEDEDEANTTGELATDNAEQEKTRTERWGYNLTTGKTLAAKPVRYRGFCLNPCSNNFQQIFKIGYFTVTGKKCIHVLYKKYFS